MKKMLMTVLIASILLIPLGGSALAESEEAPVQAFLPGSVPAQTAASDSMLPAVHGLVLALLHQDTAVYDPADSQTAWEGLYNMLALYGQLDSRCDEDSGALFLPEETVRDYAAALDIPMDQSPLPAGLEDRICYDSARQGYVLICGDEGLVQLRVDGTQNDGGALLLTGTLFDPAEDEILAQFQASLQPRDNMFGFAVTALTVL